MRIPPFRFIDDGWVFNPFHWLGPDCQVDCYPDKLFHLVAGFVIAAGFAWAYRRWRGRPGPVWAHVVIVPIIGALKEVHDWLWAQPDPDGFWRDQGPSWRDFVATVMGQAVFWLGVWARLGWRAARRRTRAEPAETRGPPLDR